MIKQAIEDIEAGCGRPKWSPRGRLAADARDWIFGPPRGLSFETACDFLGVSADVARAAILRKWGDG